MKKIWPLVIGLLVCAALPAFGQPHKQESKPIKVEVAVSVSLVSASSEPDPTKAPCEPDQDVRTSELCAVWKSADAAAGIDWENLLVGFLSVGAAIFAGVLLLRQINQTEKHEQARLKRKYIAARATLPLALTEICDFAKANIDQLKPVYVYVCAAVAHTSLPPLPGANILAIPDNVMTIINAMLESTPHESVADRLSDMIAKIQVFQSRLRGNISSNFGSGVLNRDDTIKWQIVTAGEIYVMAESLFDYARDKTAFDSSFDLAHLTYDDFLSAANAFDLDDEAFEPVFVYVTERRDARRIIH